MDPASVAASYIFVLGGLAAYVVSINRRVRVRQRTAEALEHARRKDRIDGTVPTRTPVAGRAPDGLR